MIWMQFLATALVIVFGGTQLARYGDVLGEKSGLGRSWIGLVLLAATTSLPELFTGFSATALSSLPEIAMGNVLGSNLFNLLILGLDDVFYRRGPLLAGADVSHSVTVLAVVTMNALFLIGLTYRVITKRFAVAWDTGAIAAVYVTAIVLAYVLSVS